MPPEADPDIVPVLEQFVMVTVPLVPANAPQIPPAFDPDIVPVLEQFVMVTVPLFPRY
jgi:hypothetical protein